MTVYLRTARRHALIIYIGLKQRLAAICGIRAATISTAPQGSTDNTGSTTDPGSYSERFKSTVAAAGAAFHACIAVGQRNLAIVEGKYTVWANLGATTTTGAFCFIKM
jgi:hypothetical protein